MSRPSFVPTWATVGGSAIVIPTSGKQAAGWAPAERPPAQYLNALQNANGAWIQYLDGIVSSGEREVPLTGGFYADATPTGTQITASSSSWVAQLSIPLPVGARIDQFRVVGSKANTTGTTIQLTKYPAATVGSLSPSVVVVNTDTRSTSGGFDVTYAVSSPIAIAAGERWFVTCASGASGDTINQVQIYFSHP